MPGGKLQRNVAGDPDFEPNSKPESGPPTLLIASFVIPHPDYKCNRPSAPKNTEIVFFKITP